jgi:peptidoglycan/LPS O-acetylase OafA/YrhL
MSTNTISEKESNAIVIIRATAMFSIILCHLFQAYDNYLASVFNVGVQVFLVMSGYLYGKKEITKWQEWYKKRFIKLYIPYFIVAFSVTLLFVKLNAETVTWYEYLVLLTNLQGLRMVFHNYLPTFHLSSLLHLWFMTAIMFAYFSTPLLQQLKKYSHFCILVLLILVLPCYILLRPRFLFGLEWFWLYAFGYFFANLSDRYKNVLILLFALCYIALATRITGLLDITLWKRLGRCHHCTLGILLFTLGVTYLRCFTNTSRIMPIFRWFDKYSYFIFLAHFVVMIGTFSLAHVTDYLIINILLMILASAILTYLLIITTKQITKRIKQ